MSQYYAVLIASIVATIFRLALLWALAVPYMLAHDTLEVRGTAYTVLSGLELAVFGVLYIRLTRLRWPFNDLHPASRRGQSR